MFWPQITLCNVFVCNSMRFLLFLVLHHFLWVFKVDFIFCNFACVIDTKKMTNTANKRLNFGSLKAYKCNITHMNYFFGMTSISLSCLFFTDAKVTSFHSMVVKSFRCEFTFPFLCMFANAKITPLHSRVKNQSQVN